MQSLQQPQKSLLTFPDGTVLTSDDLVLATLQLGWFPVPCKILEILELPKDGESGNVLVQPLIALTGIVTGDSPRWVPGFYCRRLDCETALRVVQASNQLLAAVPPLVLDRSH